MRGKPITEQCDIKTFKRNYKKVPLADYTVVKPAATKPVETVSPMTISMLQPQA